MSIATLRTTGGIRSFFVTGDNQSYAFATLRQLINICQPLTCEIKSHAELVTTSHSLLLGSRQLVTAGPKNSVTRGVSNNW